MKQQSITSLPLSPEEERRRRMIKYSLAMGVRVVCILLMLVAQGWWLLLCALGAIVLPYVAVVIANVQVSPPQAPVLRPGGVEIYRGDDTGGSAGSARGGYDAGSDTGDIYKPEGGK
ncbi:DUF3099 domain-containing protein [Cryobacterium frigoriphilum]|uniref:DUF3099 domain-containing protein n=1 Tax=Cryobacterium frigoriphilum TaxID=1259150 RepID=A0A4R8ZU45_9MICO|nr:DUF3099 domain-containing protein [Cryobacterium frigoriphilum]TFD45626.1 DUF3099 domain-containing protein [Cryobacterium frigoriphilum]